MSTAASSSASATPVSYANHAFNMDKNQSMPMQARKANAKVKKENNATVPANPTAAAAPSASAQPQTKAQPPKSNTKPAPAAAKKEKDVSPSPPPSTSPLSDRPFPPPRTYYSGYGVVKAVVSGDTLLLAGSSHGGIEVPERTITLTNVIAPKFGRGKNATDEPYAWESREYLRKHVIGQQVHFTVQHTAEGGHGLPPRDYGVVKFKNTDIATQMLKAGWVRVKPGKDGKSNPERDQLLAVEADAAKRGLGLHRKGANPADHVRQIDWEPDTQALFQANKNIPLPAVVDQVRDGSVLRVELIHPANPLRHTMVYLNLSGVSCPRTPIPLSVLKQQHEKKKTEDSSYKGKAPAKEDKAEPFAIEAQQFTEARLLNRDVQVYLQGVDKQGNLFGSIGFTKGNISQKLLEAGLGKLVPWSAALTPDADKLRAAEAQAKAQKLRLWANYYGDDASSSSSPSSASTLSGEFIGKVVQVPSTDSLVVEDSTGKEIRIWLASVRAPRLAGLRRDAKDEPYAQEAKELLRSKLIGHKVRIIPEYVRASQADDDRAPRQFATVFLNKQNMNELLIQSGYGEAMQHRMDEDRSQFYDALLAAENRAKEAQRGKWNPRQPTVTRITDLTERVKLPKKKAKKPKKAPANGETDGAEADVEDEEEKTDEKKAAPSKAEVEAMAKNKQLSAKAKQYLVFLQREKQVNAIVEFVFSASRFKLLVPKEHVLISFALAGVRTPSVRGPDGKPDPLAEEVLQYVRSKVQQHTVRIEVETMDKSDNFLGSMFLNNRVNLAVDLLQQGYASIFGFSAAKSPYSRELFAAEREAKEARRGLWKDWVEPTADEKSATGEDDDSKGESGSSQERQVKITEIVDVSDFYLQYVGDKNAEIIAKALADIAAAAEAEQESDEPATFNPPESAKGKPFVAAGQFHDDSWHRVRCDGVNSEGDWNVYFIDFGNYDTLVSDRLRHLAAEVASLPPLAVHCALAGLQPPKTADYQEGSAMAFSAMAFGLELNAKVEFVDRFGRKHVTLTHESQPMSLNRALLRDGQAKVQQRPDRRIQRLIPELMEEQKHAIRHHYNIFEYGDVSDEEDGERVAGPDPRARPGKGKGMKK